MNHPIKIHGKPDPKQMRREICHGLGVSVGDLSRTGPQSRAKKLTAARITVAMAGLELCGMSLTESAQLAGMKSYGSIHDAKPRFERGDLDNYAICKLYRSMIVVQREVNQGCKQHLEQSA